MIADHACSQVRPDHLEKMILPFMEEIFSAFPGAVRIYHNEGHHSDEHGRIISGFGADLWHFGTGVHSLPALYTKIGAVLE